MIDAPNFTAKFSKRPAHLDTQAFQEALKLAELHSDESNSHQGEAIKLLKLGYMGRKRLVTTHSCFSSFSEQAQTKTTRRLIADRLATQPVAQTLHNAILNQRTQDKVSNSGLVSGLNSDAPNQKMKPMKKSAPVSCVSSVAPNKSSAQSIKSSCAPKLAVGQSKEPKSSRKKQKHIGIEIDVQPPPSLERTDEQRSFQLQKQLIQTAKSKFNSVDQDLCPHHIKPHNCPICTKRTFASWKQPSIDDFSDNDL